MLRVGVRSATERASSRLGEVGVATVLGEAGREVLPHVVAHDGLAQLVDLGGGSGEVAAIAADLSEALIEGL